MKTIAILILSTLLSLNQKAISQENPGHQISGTISDSISKKPLDYITVSLKSANNAAIKATLSKADGSFRFQGLKPSKYSITIVAIGYKPKNIAVDLSDSTMKSKDFGAIYISARSNDLKEVMVIGDKPIMTQEIDRISYNLQADPDSKGSNVLEMMRKVPLLSLDAEDNIQLKGDKNYKILINGKPSSMVERNPKDILRSMPASSIEKIEVITTPPAKYDAEGLTGIINIITNKKVDNGYNGSLNLNERFPVGGPGIGGSFTVKQGKFGTSGYGGGSLHNSPSTENSNSRLTFDNTNATNLNQSGSKKSESRSAYFGSELSYEIDSLNLISGQFNINGNQSEGDSHQQSLMTGNNETIESYQLENTNEGKGNGIDAALNYQLGFKSNKNRLLTFSYRFFTYSNRQFNSLDVTEPVRYFNPDYKQNNKGSSSEQTFQIDYAYPVKKLTIEAGVKGILRNNKSDFRYDSLNTDGFFELDPQRSNKFNNRQSILGAYNSYQYNLKDWGFKGGLRLEQTLIDVEFISSASQLQKNYLNLVPSISLNRKLKNMSSLTLGYSYKIKRPGIYQLNPFVDRSNPNFESSGNPNLRPASASGIELKYSRFKKGSINVGISYEFYSKLIMPISTFNEVTKITRTTFGNTGKARVIGSNVNVNYPLTTKWNVTINAQAGHGKVSALVNNTLVENDGLMYYVSGSTGYKLEKGLRVNVNMHMNGPNLTLQGTSNSYIGSSIGVNKDLVKDKLSFSVTANNPFTKYRYYISETNGTNFRQESTNQNFFRTYSGSLNYRFGKLKSSVKKSKKGIINDDAGGGMGG
ncbi:outer membrane beta-barrel protein [Pedobacter sp. P351]|uniref:outer membrane beta-barrel protein n=1 Tax=Pedobacter superstes TaxID=3133441 RepID=UPI0030B656E3